MTDETTFAVPPPDPELARLEPLIGRWRSEGVTRPTDALGPAVPTTSVENFEWFDGGYFLVSTYETTFGDQPVQRGVNWWRYDSDDGRFRITFFSNNGPYTEEGNHYEGAVGDRALTFEGPARFQYRLDPQGRIAVAADGSISVEWWLREEFGDWQEWMENRFVRIG